MATSSKPLHFGGSMSGKTGRLGSKPVEGLQYRTRRRVETIIKLEAAGFTRIQIAAMLCVSVNRLAYIMKSSDYLIARTAMTYGIILDEDARLKLIMSQRKDVLRQFLPAGLQILANELQRPAITIAERKHQVALVQDLMDREGTLAKVSKSEIKLDDKFDYNIADKTSQSVISAIRASAPMVGKHHTVEAVAANAEFSNSHTLSAVDQQQALQALEDAAASGEFDAALLSNIPATSRA